MPIVQTHTLPTKERLALGREARNRITREAQATWTPPHNRVDPIDLLIAGSEGRGDMFLGWATGAGEGKRPFYMRQLRDAKIEPVVEVMKPLNLRGYARLCGQALARSHARSGDALVLTSYMGKSNAFEDAITKFAVAYAKQNKRDYQALVTAVRDGRVQAQTNE